MEYDFEASGKKIRILRKSKGWSQDEFIEMLSREGVPISRARIVAIEKGDEQKFSLPFLLACHRLFDCDVGYLLGEYDNGTTRDNHFIAQKTGLGDAAIRRLSAAKEQYRQFQIDQLGKLIQHDLFWKILKLLVRYDSFFENHARIRQNVTNRIWALSKEGKEPEDDETYRNAVRQLDKENMNYELDKSEAVVLFRQIVNDFLPPLK